MIPPSVYSTLISINIALIAAALTVFVISVTFLGRAIKKATDAKIEAQKKQEAESEQSIKMAEKNLKNKKPEEARKELDILRSKNRKLEQKTEAEIERYQSLTAKKCVFYPSLCFTISITLSVLSGNMTSNSIVEILLFVTSILILSLGAYFISMPIIVVGEIAKESDEVNQRSMVDAFKTALVEHENEKKPSFIIKLRNSEPIKINKNDKFTVTGLLYLEKGYAESVDYKLFFPEKFKALNSNVNLAKQPPNFIFPEYISTCIISRKLYPNCWYVFDFEFVAPNTSGKFEFAYQAQYLDFDSGLKKFKVEVTD